MIYTTPLAESSKLIIIEGPDASGKTTAVQYIMQMLADVGIDAITVRNPDDTEVGRAVRQLIKSPNAGQMTPLTWMTLYTAAIAQVMEEVVRPALRNGTWVVMDRYYWSTLVHQGIVQGVDTQLINSLRQIYDHVPCEQVTIYLDTPFEVTLERIKQRGDRDYWEESETRLRRLYDAYVDVSKQYPHLTLEEFLNGFRKQYGE